MTTSGTGAGIRAVDDASARPVSGPRLRLDLATLCSLTAVVLLVLAFFLPLWTMDLLAPQYPNGLTLTAYGTTMEGDLQEINSLNHYAGVKPIHPDDVVELKLFPYLLGGYVALVLASIVYRRRLIRLATLAMAWGFPIGFLIDVQYWLYTYGHNLKEEAPLYPGPFTPRVLGSTQVVNFHSETMVDIGWWLLFVAAILISVGPPVIRWFRDSWNNTGSKRVAAAAAVLAVGGAVFAALPDATDARAAEPGDLQAMIAAADPGSTVAVPAGQYDGPIVIDKPITLVGVDWPVVDAHGTGHVLTITADGVTVRGFVIRGSGREVSSEPSGIWDTGNRSTIEGNRLTDILYGISLHGGKGHVVRENSIQGYLDFPAERRGHALYLYNTSDNVLANNHISHAKDGIYINFSDHNMVEYNTVKELRYGIHFMYANDTQVVGNTFSDNLTGATVMYSDRLLIENNEFAENRSVASGYGLLFKDVNDITLVGNRIHHNVIGLNIEGTPLKPESYARFEGNLLGYNHVAVRMSSTTNVTFSDNSFIGNMQQVETSGGSVEAHNVWSPNGRGNYWDVYQGYDASGDGIGDVPFRYEGLYEDLAGNHPALEAYRFTFAQAALDLTARWFPVYRPDPRVVDKAPLMAPTITLPRDSSNAAAISALGSAIALFAVPIVAFWLARTSFQRGWDRCST